MDVKSVLVRGLVGGIIGWSVGSLAGRWIVDPLARRYECEEDAKKKIKTATTLAMILLGAGYVISQASMGESWNVNIGFNSIGVSYKSSTRAIGSGNVVEKVYSDLGLSSINKVQLNLPANAVINLGRSPGSLTVVADENIQPFLAPNVTGEQLSLGSSSSFSTHSPIKYQLDLPTQSLSNLSVSGAGTATVQGLSTDNFSCKIAGVGAVKVVGTATNQTIHASGASSYQALSLLSKFVEVTAENASSVTVKAEDSLSVTASGASSVIYSGNPRTVTTMLSSASRIQKV